MTNAELVALLKEARDELADLWADTTCSEHLKVACEFCSRGTPDRLDAAVASLEAAPSNDTHLLYIAGMPEPFVVPERAYDYVWHAICHGEEAGWNEDNGTLTRINAKKLAAARLVPSAAHQRKQLEWRAQCDREREAMEERARKREQEAKR